MISLVVKLARGSHRFCVHLKRVTLAKRQPDLFAIIRRSMTDEVAAKCARKSVRIGTHNGSFHCDEVLACFMLTSLPEYKEADIIRTRDETKLAECDIVVDVGGVYDASKHRYDHHQRTFDGTMNSLCGAKWTTKLSSAGLVYLHFGRRVIAEITSTPSESHLVELLYDKVYENFIEEVDGIDNGVDPCSGTQRYAVTTNLSSRVGYFHPPWNKPELSTDENYDRLFRQAMTYAGKEFTDRILYYKDVWWPARSLVEDAYQTRCETDASGEIMVLSKTSCPWKDHLLEIESKLEAGVTLVKYVLFADLSNTWRIQCVPVSKSSFENRLSLPESWRGLRDSVLSEKTGIDGCIFVHASGFIGGNSSYEGVLAMAKKALKLNQSQL